MCKSILRLKVGMDGQGKPNFKHVPTGTVKEREILIVTKDGPWSYCANSARNLKVKHKLLKWIAFFGSFSCCHGWLVVDGQTRQGKRLFSHSPCRSWLLVCLDYLLTLTIIIDGFCTIFFSGFFFTCVLCNHVGKLIATGHAPLSAQQPNTAYPNPLHPS